MANNELRAYAACAQSGTTSGNTRIPRVYRHTPSGIRIGRTQVSRSHMSHHVSQHLAPIAWYWCVLKMRYAMPCNTVLAGALRRTGVKL